MRYALIFGDEPRINQIIESKSDQFPLAEPFRWVECGVGVTEQHTYEGTKFVAPPRYIPRTVSAAQARIALHRRGLLSAVETAVAGDPEMQIWFDHATVWERANSNVNQLCTGALPLTQEDIDDLFVEAEAIGA